MAVAVSLSAYGAYVFLSVPTTPTLTVYTYGSFLGGGCGTAGAPAACDAVFGAFERAHHVRIVVESPPGTLASTLIAQAASPRADVVIGLDEISGPQAAAAGVLVPYTPPGIGSVPAQLAEDLGSGGFVTPYEYGYLAIDANLTRGPSAAALANWSFPAVAANSSLARQLLIEDPTTDITGGEFLLWEIAFYTSVLHGDWTSFWRSVDGAVQVAPDWSTAFAQFTGPPDGPPMVVSYSLDPAYAAVYGGPGFRTILGQWNGTSYGWRTVYGLGIVHGTAHADLARSFVDWFLTGTVQSQLPLNEWEYPANASVPLPDSFSAAIAPGSIVPLNAALPASVRTANWPSYVDTWQAIANQHG